MKSISKRTDSSSYHRYLKPGALAQLRDSIISARSHNTSDSLAIQAIAGLIRSPSQSHASLDVAPQFVTYSFSPRHLSRKKLVAARSVRLQSLAPTATPDSLINLLAAH